MVARGAEHRVRKAQGVASQAYPAWPLPAPAPPWTSRPAPRATTHAHKQSQTVGGNSAECGGHHGGKGHKAPREEGAGGGIPSLPACLLASPARFGRRAPRPARPPTHRIHTSNHRQSAATPPCAGPGAPRWREPRQTRCPPPATKHAIADGGAGGRRGGPTSAPTSPIPCGLHHNSRNTILQREGTQRQAQGGRQGRRLWGAGYLRKKREV